jgi:hypothetical protein
MAEYHLAQCNIGRLRAPLESPLIADFVAVLDPINRLADEAPGFVWRLQGDEGDSDRRVLPANSRTLLDAQVIHGSSR